MSEGGLGDPVRSGPQATGLNPRNLEYLTGASSTGSGVAVVAGHADDPKYIAARDAEPRVIGILRPRSSGAADSIALVTAPEPQVVLYQDLEGQTGRLHRIGDCLAPRKIDHALYEGALAGRELWETEQRTIPEAGLERRR